MPELPDLETYRRYLGATALHQRIARAHVGAPALLDQGLSPQGLGRRLHGKPIEEAGRHGKFLFARVDEAGWLVLHFGMTGRLEYARSADGVADEAEFRLEFENGAALAYVAPRKLGRIGWTEDPEAFVEAEALGPDALDIDAERWLEMAGSRRGQLKSWLMDQQAMAGIGNVYSDEILLRAGLHPKRKVADLSEAELLELRRALHEVMSAAIEAQANPQAMPADFLVRHRNEGEDCPRCGGKVQRIRAAGRSAYLCPSCQKR